MTTVVEKRWVKCDRCGAEIHESASGHTRHFSLRSVLARGASQFGAGWEKGWEVEDLCSSCENKLKTWLIDEGFTVVEIDEEL